MREKLETLAGEIRSGFEGMRQAAQSSRKNDPSLVLESGRADVSMRVCAVDGGLLYGRMHGADIVVARAVAVVFDYERSALKSHAYHPSKCPESEVEIRSSLEEHEALVFRSLIRLKHEVSCAISALKTHNPKLLLLDGSLLPLPSDRPPEGSPLRALYLEVTGLYRSLYAECLARRCMLCGVIKDSRSKKLAKELGASCSDTLLCSHLLGEGERTRESNYSDSKSQFGADEPTLGAGVSVFYIRPSKNDLPLRIEAFNCDVGQLASLICSLSSLSENYAYPAALIEADLRAALDPAELEAIQSSLASLSGMSPLRRNSRPFR